MASKHVSISAQERERIIAVIRQFRLDEIDPQLPRLLASINVERPAPLDARLWEAVKERVSAYLQGLTTDPFLPAPASRFAGDLLLCEQKCGAIRILIGIIKLAEHLIIVGRSGSGKTTFLHHLLLQLLRARIRLAILDLKDDSRYLLQLHPFIVFYPHLPFNPLQVPSYLAKDDVISLFITCFTKAFYGGQWTLQVLNEALHLAYSRYDNPCPADLKRVVDGLCTKSDTYSRRDAIRGVSLRLERLRTEFPGCFSNRVGVSWQTIIDHSWYLPAAILTDVAEFFFTLSEFHLFLHNRYHQVRNTLTHVAVWDEGLNTWAEDNARRIDRAPLAATLATMVREFSIGMLTTTTSLAGLSPLLRSSAYTQVVMGLSSSAELLEVTRTFGLSAEQARYLDVSLPVGECILKLADGWKSPILGIFPPLPIDKRISLAEYEQAKRYAEAFIPKTPPTPPVTMTTPTAEPVPLALSPLSLTLLGACADRLAPITEHFETIQCQPERGIRAAKDLVRLDLAKKERIVGSAGRGGTCMIYFPTTAGFARLGRKPRSIGKGGSSLQHQYLVQELAANLPGALIDHKFGEKAVDIAVRFDPHQHARLATYLDGRRSLFTPKPLGEGDFVGIEVELTPAKTARNNAVKNRDAGIALTITGVMPKLVKPTVALLADLPYVVVVDVLKLLEHLPCSTKIKKPDGRKDQS